jgi:hypothetical protein
MGVSLISFLAQGFPGGGFSDQRQQRIEEESGPKIHYPRVVFLP